MSSTARASATASVASRPRMWKKLVSLQVSQVGEGPYHQQRALALGDVAAEVLALSLGVSDEVQEVVLQLEGKAGAHAKLVERAQLLGRAATAEGARDQGHRGGVVGRLVAGHVEVVLNGDVPAAIAGPAQVEGLALERALLHLHQALRHVRTDVGRELLVAKDQRQHVDQARGRRC